MEAFVEKQSFFRHWWMFILPGLLVAAYMPFSVGFNGATDPSALLISLCVTAVLCGILSFLSLSSRVDETGVTMRFRFQLDPTKIDWAEVKTVNLGKYHPMEDYGGWGYRWLWKKKRTAFNVAGNKGLKLTLNDGRIILLGTQQMEKMGKYLQYIKEKYGIAALKGLSTKTTEDIR